MSKKCLLALAACTLMFAACGDDVTKINEVHQDGMAVLDAGEKLSKQACDTTNVGEMLFVTDSSEVFFCDGKSWQTLKGEKGADGKDGKDGADGEDGKDGKNGVNGKDGEKGTNCTASENDEGDFDLVCDDKIVGTIKNGENGADGTNCTAKSVKNDAGLKGLEVTCGETVVGTIWNGEKGEKGNDGKGCSTIDNGDGTVSATCGEGEGATTTTIFKAVCGTKPYDPKKQFCDTRDNQIYGYVTIAEGDYAETWMAENLNYADSAKTPSLKGKSWCGGGSGTTEGDCSKYGRLYTWAAAIDSVALASDAENSQTCGYGNTCTLPAVVQGVCPSGWHLPTDAEWETLFTAVGGSSIAGKMLKSQTGWNDNENGEDAYGFSALPAGYRSNDGNFNVAGYFAYFWSATQGEYDVANDMSLYGDMERAFLYYDYKDHAFSVRCLQNN